MKLLDLVSCFESLQFAIGFDTPGARSALVSPRRLPEVARSSVEMGCLDPMKLSEGYPFFIKLNFILREPDLVV